MYPHGLEKYEIKLLLSFDTYILNKTVVIEGEL